MFERRAALRAEQLSELAEQLSELAEQLSELAERLDWGSLEPLPASFVDERLRGGRADLSFSVGCEGRPAPRVPSTRTSEHE